MASSSLWQFIISFSVLVFFHKPYVFGASSQLLNIAQSECQATVDDLKSGKCDWNGLDDEMKTLLIYISAGVKEIVQKDCSKQELDIIITVVLEIVCRQIPKYDPNLNSDPFVSGPPSTPFPLPKLPGFSSTRPQSSIKKWVNNVIRNAFGYISVYFYRSSNNRVPLAELKRKLQQYQNAIKEKSLNKN